MAARIAHPLLVALVILNAASCTEPKKDATGASGAETAAPGPEAAQASVTEPTRPKPFFVRFYTPPQLEIEANVPQYKLPLKPDEIVNWTVASQHFKCKGTAELILRNGFAVEEGWGEQLGLIEDAYDNLPDGVPMFVTVDTVLHIQHVLYDQLFSQIERTFMLADLQAVTAAALEWFKKGYDALERKPGASMKQMTAARLNLAYFAVAARLLDPEAVVPRPVLKEVDSVLLSMKAGGIVHNDIFRYPVDYGQFEPRGHYTRSEELERYFRTMTWYAQCAFLFRGGRGMIVDAGTADIQTIQAIQIGRFFVENEEAYSRWQRMQAVLQFFAGTMDDVSVADVVRIKNALDAELAAIAAEPPGESAYLKLVRERLLALPPPRIHAATGLPIRREATTPEQRREWLEQARGMRLFGQRFSLDAYTMSELTGFTYMGDGRPFTRADTPLGPVRGYPSPLDVMALLGSERAEKMLREAGDAEYAHYDRELARLKSEFAQLTDEDWHSNVAMCRLSLIRMLLQPVPKGYPTAMQSAVWHDRYIDTGLAAWAQLRRDMVLSHKEPWSPVSGGREPERAAGYVEPSPAVYVRMLAVNRALMEAVWRLYPQQRGAAPRHVSERVLPVGTTPIGTFSDWLSTVNRIALQELKDEPPAHAALEFLGRTPEELRQILFGIEGHSRHPAVVGDVFTQPDEGRVLEVATGRFNLLWVVYQLPSGEKVLGAGPVMSYYEFKQPMAARLTDEEWREMIEQGQTPDPPAWTESFLARQPKDGQ